MPTSSARLVTLILFVTALAPLPTTIAAETTPNDDACEVDYQDFADRLISVTQLLRTLSPEERSQLFADTRIQLQANVPIDDHHRAPYITLDAQLHRLQLAPDDFQTLVEALATITTIECLEGYEETAGGIRRQKHKRQKFGLFEFEVSDVELGAQTCSLVPGGTAKGPHINLRIYQKDTDYQIANLHVWLGYKAGGKLYISDKGWCIAVPSGITWRKALQKSKDYLQQKMSKRAFKSLLKALASVSSLKGPIPIAPVVILPARCDNLSQWDIYSQLVCKIRGEPFASGTFEM